MPESSDQRAERALREALSRRAGAFTPLPLVVDTAPPAPRRTTARWWALAAVAAALVLAVPGVALLGPDRDGTAGPGAVATQGVDQEDPDGGPGPAEPGNVWVTYRDVAVQVPREWAERDLANGVDPGWCVGDEMPSDPPPYVARAGLNGVQFMIGCGRAEPGRPEAFGSAPKSYWAPHVSFAPAPPQPADGTQSYDGWTVVTRTLGGLQVRVWSPDADADLAARIAGSGREVSADQNGCPSESVVQLRGWSSPAPATDLAALGEVEGGVVCRYVVSRPGTPGLYASHVLDRGEAEDLVAALLAAPGPEGGAGSSCAADDVVLLRLRHPGGVAELHAAVACLDGAVRDGTRSYDLTPEACARLASGPGTRSQGAFRVLASCRA